MRNIHTSSRTEVITPFLLLRDEMFTVIDKKLWMSILKITNNYNYIDSLLLFTNYTGNI